MITTMQTFEGILRLQHYVELLRGRLKHNYVCSFLKGILRLQHRVELLRGRLEHMFVALSFLKDILRFGIVLN